MKPIEYGGEGYETQEGNGEFFIPGTHASVTFDSSKEILNDVAMFVESFGEVVLDTTRFSWWNTGGYPGSGQVLPKAFRIEAAVCDNPAASEGADQSCDRTEVMAVSGNEVQPHSTSKTIDDRSQFRVRTTFGFTDRLHSSSTRGIGGVLVNLDVATVDAAQLAARAGDQLLMHLGPELCLAPSTEARIDRTPRTELLWQVTPRQTRSKYIKDSAHHDAVVFRWSAAGVLRGHTSCAGVIRSIFLSAPRADQQFPCDLMYSL